jgi:hypothetical protein
MSEEKNLCKLNRDEIEERLNFRGKMDLLLHETWCDKGLSNRDLHYMFEILGAKLDVVLHYIAENNREHAHELAEVAIGHLSEYLIKN